jgi:type II secretion system protein H
MVRKVGKGKMPTWIAATFKRLETGDWRLVSRGWRLETRDLLYLPAPVTKLTPLIPSLSSASLKPPASSLQGFTLLELSLVLFIIGLLVTVLVPRLGGLEHARLETSAKRLAALVRYLHGEAAFRGQTYRIQYDLDQHRYEVQVLTPSQATKTFVADESPLSQTVQLPTNVTFADIRVPSVGRVRAGQVFTHFYPQGYTDPTVVHLRDQQSRTMTVIIPPITGEAAVYEGYVDAHD